MRRTISALLILGMTISLTACGAGNNASTRQVKQVTDGVEASITSEDNNIKLVNMLVVATPDGAGVLVGTILNENVAEDALLALTINGKLATITGKSVLVQNSPIIFEGASANSKAVTAELGAKAGDHVRVSYFFAKAGQVDLLALIRDQRDTYAGITAK
jgi:hypothetical protein